MGFLTRLQRPHSICKFSWIYSPLLWSCYTAEDVSLPAQTQSFRIYLVGFIPRISSASYLMEHGEGYVL